MAADLRRDPNIIPQWDSCIFDVEGVISKLAAAVSDQTEIASETTTLWHPFSWIVEGYLQEDFLFIIRHCTVLSSRFGNSAMVLTRADFYVEFE